MTGPSGSGKTTLLTLIGGLRAAQAGSISSTAASWSGLRASPGRPPPADRLHLPAPQPFQLALARRERTDGHRLMPGGGAAAAHAAPPRSSNGSGWATEALPSRPTFGRSAPAGGDRPGPGQPAPARACRRADGRPRRHVGRRRDGTPPRARRRSRALDRPHRHPRPAPARPRRPDREHGRRPDRLKRHAGHDDPDPQDHLPAQGTARPQRVDPHPDRRPDDGRASPPRRDRRPRRNPGPQGSSSARGPPRYPRTTRCGASSAPGDY